VPTNYLVAGGIAWVLIGLVVAFVMRRRGHDLYVWMVLGFILGPIAIPVAIERIRFHEKESAGAASTPTPERVGFDMLAGLDGSEEAANALHSALALFGWDLSNVTLATVLDYDSELSPGAEEARREAGRILEEVAESLDFSPVKTKLLFGKPDRALAEFARSGGFELIVAGARGRGASKRLFGSVTEQPVGDAKVPVFVGPKHSDG
jgi:nucleotide-binding universal stress UspA family protein